MRTRPAPGPRGTAAAPALACLSLGLALLLPVLPARAAFTVPGFELVYTPPLETSLARPGLRSPLAVWPELFDGAKRTLDIEHFYVAWRPGEALDPVLAHLERAGARGVRIRFLVDASMAPKDPAALERLRRVKGLELRVYPFGKLRGRGIVHAKYMVADGRTGFVGSHNFDWRSLSHVQELGLLVREPEVAGRMEAIFEEDWRLAAELEAGRSPPPLQTERPAPDVSRRAYLVASPWSYAPPGVGDSEAELVRLMGSAAREIAVQVLDYVPLDRKRQFYPPIDNALRAAAARGVKVRLLVSNWNAEPPAIDHLKSLALVPGVSIRMVTIPEAKAGFIPYARVVHAKYMTIDGEVLWLGTSNFCGGYLTDSRNLEVVVRDARLASEARALHEQLWTSPYAEAVEAGRTYPLPKKH